MARKPLLLALLLSALLAPHAAGQERYIRYRLVEPDASSIARVLIMIHTGANPGPNDIPFSWTGYQLPGVISRSDLYVPAGEWSDWYALPTGTWGTIDLQLRGDVPLQGVRTQVQFASPLPEARFVLRELDLRGQSDRVGFMLPDEPLQNPRLVEGVEAGLERREKLARQVAVDPQRRPRLLSFSPAGVRPDPTIARSAERELGVIANLGFNTLEMDQTGEIDAALFPYRQAHSTGDNAARDARHAQAYRERYGEQAPPVLYSLMFDEPAWYSGFRPIWAQTGRQGFLDYLQSQGVQPTLFEARDWSTVQHLPRNQPIAANASPAQRRLWYWSNRYTDYACARYFRQLTETSHQNFPNTLTTVNFSDHAVILFAGMIAGGGCNVFEFGRQAALDMYWTEDWMFHGLNSWGNGLWQRVGFLTELLRAGGRYHHQPHPVTGFYVVPQGFDPLSPDTDSSIPTRVNLLLGRGSKYFGFFTYGPTARVTRDFWSDNARTTRGLADAFNTVGPRQIEPLLHAGVPTPNALCLLYSPTAEYWQALNQANERNQEKQYAWMMLQQQGLTADIIDQLDGERFLPSYRAALLVDLNLDRAAAGKLQQWVEAGGTLLLWPDAGSRDEFNEPLDTFAAVSQPGQQRMGKGTVVRLGEMAGAAWWASSRAMAEAQGSAWACDFDDAAAKKLADPLRTLARLEPPARANLPGVIVDTLTSEQGVALLLTNLRGLRDDHGLRYLNLTVTLAAGFAKDHEPRAAISSRQGELPWERLPDGSISVTLPLETTDIVALPWQ